MRCPLTVKFGKDIAGLISRMVWLSYIKQVNNEHHLLFTWVTSKNFLYGPNKNGINNRHRDTMSRFPFHDLVYDMYTVNSSASLPKNYWEIKELY
jgi:hypothetical protein